MSDRVYQAVKFAVLGSTIGAVTGVVGDYVYTAVVPLLGSSSNHVAGNLGKAALAVVASSAVAATVVYAGDSVMQSIGGLDDPLAGAFFYASALGSMQASHVAPQAIMQLVKTAVGGVFMPMTAAPPKQQENELPPGMNFQGRKKCMAAGGGTRCGNIII